jgi:hypothetical protein
VALLADLAWVVGGVSVDWNFQTGGGSPTPGCSGVDTVFVNFQDATSGQFAFGNANDVTTWDQGPCTSGPVTYYLPPGAWNIFLDATAVGGDYANFGTGIAPTTINVDAGPVTPTQTFVLSR